MAIVVNLDVMMVKRKISVTELANEVDITMANLSILKNNKAKAVRFTTLDAICRTLDCQPGDILEYVKNFFIMTGTWISSVGDIFRGSGENKRKEEENPEDKSAVMWIK